MPFSIWKGKIDNSPPYSHPPLPTPCQIGSMDLYNNHGEFISINNVLREYNEMKENIKNPVEYII